MNFVEKDDQFDEMDYCLEDFQHVPYEAPGTEPLLLQNEIVKLLVHLQPCLMRYLEKSYFS